MSIYYVDPSASGANDGSSWTDAWTDIQTAADTAVAGDTIYCRGTQTLTAPIDFDTNSGNIVSGYISFIGCNASGVNDGTRFCLDGNNTATYCIQAGSSINRILLENIEVKRADSYGVDYGSANYYWIFNNCSIHDNGSIGVYGYQFCDVLFFRCTFYNNSADGLHTVNTSGGFFLFCSFHDNSGDGFTGNYGPEACIGCLIYDNANYGVNDAYSTLFLSNVIDGNSDGMIFKDNSHPGHLIANRITNHNGGTNIGLNFNSGTIGMAFNYLQNNTTNYVNNSLIQELRIDGATTNVEDQGDTNQGYTSLTDGSENFNLRSDATLRRQAIVVPTE